MKGDSYMIDLKIEDALWRIEEIYKRTNGKCILSFSGGKDSTVLAYLYLLGKKQGRFGHIDIVFADTQVEYDAIYEYIEWFNENKQEVIYLKPRKPFGQVMREYGKPGMSKVKSQFLKTYQNVLQRGDNPLKLKRTSELILGVRTDSKTYEPILDLNGKTQSTRQKLADKHFNFIHPNHEYKISDKCCDYMKKYPFEDYYLENDIKGYMTGMRPAAEGGIRGEIYKSCTSFKKIKGNVELVHKMPLFDWSDDDVNAFINFYDVKISKAYTEYNLTRTGCIGCPFAKDVYKNLEVLYNYEPRKYKAVQNWLGDVYRDLQVQLPFDDEYMKLYEERQDILRKRRYEMLETYRPKVAFKWHPSKKR